MSVFESRVENYELPDSWGSGRLDEVCDQMKQGKILPQKEIHEIGRHPVLGANGCIGYCDSYFLEEERVLITCRGSTCGTINRSPEKSFVTNNAMILFEKDCLNKDFLFFALQEFSTKGLKTGSGQPQLTKGILNSHVLPLPPLPEQKKIAHILSTVQRAIEAQERIIQTTTELKKTLMHKLFTEGTRGEPQKQTEIGPVPESWEVMPLGAIAKIGNGSTPKRSNVGYWEYGNIPWLNSTKIHELFVAEADQFVTPLAVKECHLPRVAPNSLLIAITGQGKTLGNSAIVRFETCINQHLAYAQFHSEKIIPDFVLWFMQTRYDFLRSIAQAGGSTKGALTCGYLKTHLIPIPEKNEQNEIVNIFGQLENKQKVITRKRAFLQDLFRTLLHKLMTAKARVHEFELSS